MTTETPKRVIDHPDVAAIDEKQWLRERVKELEDEVEALKFLLKCESESACEAEELYEKVCTSNHSLEKEVAELMHKVNALESKQAIKLTEQICVEGEDGVKNIRQYAVALDYTPPFTSSIKTRGAKCAQCGRVL